MHDPTLPSSPFLLGMLVFSACSPASTPNFEDCGSDDCRFGHVSAAWERDPNQAVDLLVSIEDPVALNTMVMRLVEAHPGETIQLCTRLQPGAVQERCLDINRRQHLWVSPPDNTAALTPRRGDGPGSARLYVPDGVEPMFAQTSVLATPCPATADQHTCLTQRGKQAAENGDGAQAAAACEGISEPKWSQECYFQAAESRMAHVTPGAYTQAAHLCLQSGHFGENCLAHVLNILAERAPDASSGGGGGWREMTALADEVEACWNPYDPLLAQLSVDRLWSAATTYAYVGVKEVSGDPLDEVPPMARRHVYAAASFRLMQLENTERRSMEAWTSRLQQALASRIGSTSVREPKPRSLPYDVGIWRHDKQGQDWIPATVYLGSMRRPWSPDSALDATLCILAAAVWLPHGDALIDEGKTHNERLVRHAARILGWSREQMLKSFVGSGNGPTPTNPLGDPRGL